MAALSIPPITDGQLAERAVMVQPLVRRHAYETISENSFREIDLGLWYIEPNPDFRGVSFTWCEAWVRPVADGELVAAKQVRTLHTFGYHGIFKPSIAEVLAQAPDDLCEYVAYSVEGPHDADDLNRERAALDAGFHVAVTTYYKRANEGQVS